MDEKIYNVAMNAFKIESESLAATAAAIDKDQFEKAVEALGKAERIAASGCGHSGIACQHFAHLRCCIERPARFISPADVDVIAVPLLETRVTGTTASLKTVVAVVSIKNARLGELSG